MLCFNCNSLSFTYTKKKCARCQAETTTNLSVLCENCSNKDKVCAFCLKKVEPIRKRASGRCNCGGK